MSARDDLLNLEERFWTGDATFYEETLTDDCLMIFPAGVMSKREIVASVASSNRWRSVSFSGVRVLRPAEQVVIIVYQATAKRSEETTYVVFASSTYVGHKNDWRLGFHQQTPDEAS